MAQFLVTWAANIVANSKPEAAVVAMAMMNDPDNWQFNSGIDEIDEEGNEVI